MNLDQLPFRGPVRIHGETGDGGELLDEEREWDEEENRGRGQGVGVDTNATQFVIIIENPIHTCMKHKRKKFKTTNNGLVVTR